MKLKALLLKIILSLALLAILSLQIDAEQMKVIAGNLRHTSWLFSIIFILLQIGVLSLRWGMLMNVNTAHHMDLKTSLRITAASFLANYLLITSVGGIIARIGLTMNHGFSFVKSLTATIIDRGFTLLALLALTTLSLPFIPHFIEIKPVHLYVLVILVSVGVSLLCILYTNRRKIIFINRKITVCVRYLRNLLTDPLLLARILIISLISQMMYFSAVYVVMHSLNIEFSFIQFMAIMPIITLISSLPIGYGGWGIREGAFIYGLSLIHIPAEAAFMASIQVGIVSMLTAFMVGIPALINNKTQDAIKNVTRLKRVVAHKAS